MPRGKKKTVSPSNSGSSNSVSNSIPNVKVTITHIVPTTQYGNVTYKIECDANQAQEVGVFMADLIGSLYPPYNPGEINKPEPTVHVDVDSSNSVSEEKAFNQEATQLNEDRLMNEQDTLVSEFEEAF